MTVSRSPVRRRIVTVPAPTDASSNGTTAGIELLVREAGPADGPGWLLLHAGGTSSRSLTGLAAALAARGARVVAPDLPGLGDSDPLPVAPPSIADFAAAASGVCAALGVVPAAVLGQHFGARIVMELTRAGGAMADAVPVLDGVGLYAAGDLEAMLDRAAPILEPDSDGAYLIRTFQRIRDYYLFFPWFDRRAAARRSIDLPPPAVLHERLVEWLKAAPGHRAAYRAALAYPVEDWLAARRGPVVLVRRDADTTAGSFDAVAARLSAAAPRIVAAGEPSVEAEALIAAVAATL